MPILTIVQADDFLGPGSLAWLAELFGARKPVNTAMLQLGQTAWRAFTAPDPRGIVDLLNEDTAALPYLAPALEWHLEQFPSAHNGLSRSEEQALLALVDRARTPADAFAVAQSAEQYRVSGRFGIRLVSPTPGARESSPRDMVGRCSPSRAPSPHRVGRVSRTRGRSHRTWARRPGR